MGKVVKIIFLILSIASIFIVGAYLLLIALWGGAFDFLSHHEIATYSSPDGQYSLTFEQVGSPAWPFGAVDVRLTLKNNKGRKIKRVSAQVHNDGGSADEWNMKSISWNDDGVVVILQSAEMEDEEIVMPYNKR